MNCEQAEELFGIYRDLSEHSPERLLVDIHVRSCPSCAEQFRMWEESADLIRSSPLNDDSPDHEWQAGPTLSDKVMNRIYAEQSWYMPTTRRTYAFSLGFRKQVAGVLAALLALFAVGFIYSAVNRVIGADRDVTGVIETASAFADSHELSNNMNIDVPSASLSEPYVLHVTPAMPEYWVALSMLGMIMTLLILNWFSRVRS